MRQASGPRLAVVSVIRHPPQIEPVHLQPRSIRKFHSHHNTWIPLNGTDHAKVDGFREPRGTKTFPRPFLTKPGTHTGNRKEDQHGETQGTDGKAVRQPE